MSCVPILSAFFYYEKKEKKYTYKEEEKNYKVVEIVGGEFGIKGVTLSSFTMFL